MKEFLRENEYYNDLYDLWTIEKCLRIVEIHNKSKKEKVDQEEIKGLSKEAISKGYWMILELHLYSVRGERYKNKFSTIQGWKNRDQDYDKKLDNTVCPENIHCFKCNILMEAISKDTYLGDSNFRVIFLFECMHCKKRRGIFDNGEEFKVKPRFCLKCKKEIAEKHNRNEDVITWRRKCKYCGFLETEIDDFKKDEDDHNEKKRVEVELLNKYRAEFCLSEKEGLDYINYLNCIGSFQDTVKRQDDPVYKRINNLKKLKVCEVEKLLNESINSKNYVRLLFEKPEIGKYVIVPFTVQDADTLRKEYDSVNGLKKIIKMILVDTNWRLMSEGITYRLGYLFGRLKAYEQENDLIEMIKKS